METALNEVFDGKMMAGINMLKGLGDTVKDMATTCKTAWTGETMSFGSWVLGTVEDPESLGYKVTTAFLVKEKRDMLANEIGLMINFLFYEGYYFGAGNNLGLMINLIFGAPEISASDPDFYFLA